MKLLLFICLAFVCTSGEDEQLGELVNLLKDPKFSSDLLAELQKRISDGNENDKTPAKVNPPTNECKFVMNDTTIIKTKASLSNGASFIEAPQQTAGVPVDQETCLRSCCQNVNCTVAVVKKTENGCYLFNCGHPNKCLFSSHPDFAVMSLAGPHVIIPPATQHEQKQHENALEGLVTVPTTSKKPTTTPSTPKPVPTTPKQPVPLFGDCEENRDCMGSFTECIGSLCLCQKGYHAQDGMCRSDCNRFEFECANEGAPLAVPQCIAVYDRCDGIKHCRDGSDEMKCEPPSTPAPIIANIQAQQTVPQLAVQQEPVMQSGNRLQSVQVQPQQPQGYIQQGYNQQQPVQNAVQPGMQQQQQLGSQQQPAYVQPPQSQVVQPHYGDYNIPVQQVPQQGPVQNQPGQGAQVNPVINSQVPNVPSAQQQVPAQPAPQLNPIRPQTDRYGSGNNAQGFDSQNGQPLYHLPANGQGFTWQRQRPLEQGSAKQDEETAGNLDNQMPHRESSGRKPSLQREPGPMFENKQGNTDDVSKQQSAYQDKDGRQGNGVNRQRPAMPPKVHIIKPVAQQPEEGDRMQESGNKKEPPHQNRDKEQQPTPDTSNREPQNKPQPPAETQDKPTDTESQHSESEMKHEQEKPSEETGEKEENSKEEEKSNEDKDSKGDDKSDSKSDEKEREPENKPDTDQSSQKTEDSEKDKDDSESVSKEDKNTDTKESPPPTGEAEKESKEDGSTQVKRVMSAGSSLELSDEEVQKVKEYHKLSTKGPMIALALGLAITAMLLVFVGCRLRNVKHRLRRGRPVHSNEADYLINGMYL